MGTSRHGAEVWGERWAVAEKFAAALGALLLFGLAVGGPVLLSAAAAGLAAADGLVRLGLFVVERRARSRLSENTSDDGAPPPRNGLGEVADDALVVFVSCAREDQEWLRKFEVMLRPLTEKGLVVWSDEHIAVGVASGPEHDRAIDRAGAALVLVSPDLLASEFLMGEELSALRARDIPLGLVHVRASMASQVDALTDLRWAHDPDQPLQAADDPDGEIVRICQWLVGLLPVRMPDDGSELTDDGRERTTRHVPRVTPGERMGALHGVPPPATGEVQRVELAGVRDALLSEREGNVGITGHGRTVGLHGQGGVGKSVLAAALARDPDVRRHFPDGVHWLTVGERGNLVALQLALLERLGAARPQLRTRTDVAAALRATLDQRRCLLVVDDVWTVPAAVAFDVTGPRGRVLYTTRDERVLDAVGAEVRRVDLLPEDAARALLAALARARVDALPAAVDRVLAATGRVALALALVGAAVGRGGREWGEVAEKLEDARKTFLDHPYADVFKAMQIGVAALDDRMTAAYRTLAVYSPDERVPVTAITRLWAHNGAADTPEQARRMLERLAERELLVLDGDGIAFHDLQHEFLLLRAGDMRLAHDDLLGAYRALLPADDARWHRLPASEPYIWEHLLEHLRGAGEVASLYAVATDLAYLAARCARDGPYAVESDLRATARTFAGDAAIDWTIELFTRWGHLLTGHTSPGEVAAALAIRAQHPPPPLDIGALRALTPAPFLTPRWGLPNIPDGLLRTLERHANWVGAVAFSADGMLASGDDDGTVQLWDPISGELTRAIKGHRGQVRKLAFSANGILASGGDDGTVHLWNPVTGGRVHTLKGDGWIQALAFLSDDRVASANYKGIVRLWDPTCGALSTFTLTEYFVGGIALSTDGMLASGHYDGTVRLRDLGSERVIRTFKHPNPGARVLAFSTDGMIASGSDDGAVRLWDVASGELTATFKSHGGGVCELAFSTDGLLAAGSDDGTVRLWDLTVGQLSRTFQHPTRTLKDASRVRAVAFSPDGTLLASGGGDRTVRLWNPTGDQSVRTEPIQSAWYHSVEAMAFSPDGALLASAGREKIVRLWSPATGQHPRTVSGDTGWVSALAFLPDGTLASANIAGTLRFWDLAEGQLIGSLESHGRYRGDAVTMSPDGTIAIAAERAVQLWDFVSGRLTCTIRDRSRVHALAFSPDGTLLASAGDDGIVRLWNCGRKSWTPPGWGFLRRRRFASARLHGRGRVSAIAFSPDGQTLATASGDCITLWDVASRTALCRARTGNPIAAIALNADAIAAAMGTTVAVFDVVRSRPADSDPEP